MSRGRPDPMETVRAGAQAEAMRDETTRAAAAPISRARVSAKGRECPECKAELNHQLAEHGRTPGVYLLCNTCAAIAIVDSSRTIRACLTQEWWDLVTRPEWLDLMERRADVLERITRP